MVSLLIRVVNDLDPSLYAVHAHMMTALVNVVTVTTLTVTGVMAIAAWTYYISHERVVIANLCYHWYCYSFCCDQSPMINDQWTCNVMTCDLTTSSIVVITSIIAIIQQNYSYIIELYQWGNLWYYYMRFSCHKNRLNLWERVDQTTNDHDIVGWSPHLLATTDYCADI